MPLQVSTSLLRQRQTTIRYNWGFRFALWCAILWAFGYQGLDILVHNDQLLGIFYAQSSPYLVGLAIAVVFTVLLAVVSLIWVGANYGLRDWLRTVLQLSSSNLLLLASAVIGGAIAYISYVITFLMDSGFAVAMVMFYSGIGTAFAHFWYREKVSRRGIIGLFIIAFGCLLMYLAQTVASGNNLLAVLGMGIFAGLGWGVEGVLAARAMDTVDSNIAMSVRFTYEALIWLVIFVISVAAGYGQPLITAVSGLVSSAPSFLMLGLAALCIHFDYLCWYKSFVYCGVGRGLAVSTISSAITVIIGLTLTTILPSYLTAAAFAIMVIGVFLVFSERNNRFAVLRDVDLSPPTAIILGTKRPENLPLKTGILVAIAEKGRCWDHELAAELVGSKDSRRSRHLYNKLRIYLVEAQAAGMVVVLDEQVDDGSHFAGGKLLCNYALTTFGCKRLETMRLVTTEEPHQMSGASLLVTPSEIIEETIEIATLPKQRPKR